MDRLNKLDVFYHDRSVGTMALHQNRLAAFEYDSEWLADGWGRLLVDRLMKRNGIYPREGKAVPVRKNGGLFRYTKI